MGYLCILKSFEIVTEVILDWFLIFLLFLLQYAKYVILIHIH